MYLNHKDVPVIFFSGSFGDENRLADESAVTGWPCAARLIRHVELCDRVEREMWQCWAGTGSCSTVYVLVLSPWKIRIYHGKIRRPRPVVERLHGTLLAIPFSVDINGHLHYTSPKISEYVQRVANSSFYLYRKIDIDATASTCKCIFSLSVRNAIASTYVCRG